MRTRARARLAYSPPVARPKTICWTTPWREAASRRLVAKVRPPHRLVAGQLATGPRDRDVANLEHVGAAGCPERDPGVLFDEEDGHPFLLVDPGDDAKDRAHDGGGEPQRGLVQEQQPRAHH